MLGASLVNLIPSFSHAGTSLAPSTHSSGDMLTWMHPAVSLGYMGSPQLRESSELLLPSGDQGGPICTAMKLHFSSDSHSLIELGSAVQGGHQGQICLVAIHLHPLQTHS